MILFLYSNARINNFYLNHTLALRGMKEWLVTFVVKVPDLANIGAFDVDPTSTRRKFDSVGQQIEYNLLYSLSIRTNCIVIVLKTIHD